jgi:hypothetical protein
MTQQAERDLCDWIPPSMFTFCSRCGHIARLGGEEFMCLSCSDSLLGRKYDTQESQKEAEIAKKKELIDGSLVVNMRRRVAMSLKQFLPPLWWIKDESVKAKRK